MNRYIAVLIAASFLLAGRAAYSEEKALVYVVNIQKVINDSVPGKAAKNVVEQELNERRGRLEKLGAEMKALSEELEKQRAVLSEAAFQEKGEKILKQRKELERAANDLREEIARKRDSELNRIVKAIRETVEGVAKEEGYPFVIEKEPGLVLFASDKIDITDRIIDEINDKEISS